MAVVLLHFGDFAVFVVEVAKYERVSGTCLRASCLNLAVNHFAILTFGVSDASPDALYAEGTLLHDSPTADCNVRVEVVAEGLGPNRFPVVEETNDVGATIRTVSCAYTTVVDLYVQAFVVVVGRKNWAYRLTWSVFAVLAHDRDEPRLNVGELAFPVAFHAYP